jgi:D-hydroxyproline dehydrogenase subunit gamma
MRLSSQSGSRLHKSMETGTPVTIYVDGVPVEAHEGQTIAAALFAAGRVVLRRTRRHKEPRGVYCGMGVCFECRVKVGEEPALRACLTLVADGMHIRTLEEAT